MQVISTDETVRSNTGQDLKDFNTQSLATPVKKGEHSVSVMSANKKVFDLTDDDIVELSTKNKSLKKVGSCDENKIGKVNKFDLKNSKKLKGT